MGYFYLHVSLHNAYFQYNKDYPLAIIFPYLLLLQGSGTCRYDVFMG